MRGVEVAFVCAGAVGRGGEPVPSSDVGFFEASFESVTPLSERHTAVGAREGHPAYTLAHPLRFPALTRVEVAG